MIYKSFLYSFFIVFGLFVSLMIHSQYNYYFFDNSKAIDVARLTTMPYLAYNSTIYESRFDFDNKKEFHPQMPQIQYKRFVYDK